MPYNNWRALDLSIWILAVAQRVQQRPAMPPPVG
jgi:hypothetical protein